MIMITMKDIAIIAIIGLLEPVVLIGGTWLVIRTKDYFTKEEV